MKVLILGNGGREHALAWKVRQSPLVKSIYCAPGNGGTPEVAETLDLPTTEVRELYKFAKQEKVDLTIVGPEAPLAAGIVDQFEEGGLACVGPRARAARLEASKVFAKNLMRKHVIPTAEFKVFSKADEARKYLGQAYYPVVLKADGLAQGKGVFVCPTADEALQAVDRLMVEKAFGDAGSRVIVEEFLRGDEVSVHALTDGHAIVVLEDARDYKRAETGDKGPNTGGMGAYSPLGLGRDPIMRKIEAKVLVPVVHAMKREETPFAGVLYAGLMVTPTGPKVLEFNVRFGDPEAEVILPRLKSDLVPLLLATVRGSLGEVEVEWDARSAVTVVLASGGYPGAYRTGQPIHGLEKLRGREDVLVFHAGTRRETFGGRVRHFTTGGRVLAITALGATLAEARTKAYAAVREIQFDGMQYRTDIAAETTVTPG